MQFEINRWDSDRPRLKFKCDGCQRTLNAPLTDAGTTTGCPNCGFNLTIPGADRLEAWRQRCSEQTSSNAVDGAEHDSSTARKAIQAPPRQRMGFARAVFEFDVMDVVLAVVFRVAGVLCIGGVLVTLALLGHAAIELLMHMGDSLTEIQRRSVASGNLALYTFVLSGLVIIAALLQIERHLRALRQQGQLHLQD